MILIGIALGLLLGLLVRGSLSGFLANLADVRLRGVPLLLAGVIVRFGTEGAINRGFAPAEALRLPLFSLGFALLLFGLWLNRRQPGILLGFVGILSNATAIAVNGGHMPIWEPALTAAGFTLADVPSTFHVVLPPPIDASFLLHAGPIADVIPIPFSPIRNVASVGDLFLSGGFAFFLFATAVRRYVEPEELAVAGAADLGQPAAGEGLAEEGIGWTRPWSTGLASGLAQASSLDRPLVLGSAAAGMAGPSSVPVLRRAPTPTPGVAIRLARRARDHPYVRLALNGSFSALWVGQLISLFGDRANQIAVVFLVLRATGSPVAVALVFVAATIPNLLLGPLAGTFVDRWSHQETMVVSDLLRGAAVLLIPVVAFGGNLLLVYPLLFLVTTISLFFRPARTAILPRIVSEGDLLTANSAMWIGETLADVVGYPLAGLFVAFLGPALPLAFWFDSATYVASAVLIASMVVPPLLRRGGAEGEPRREGIRRELVAGWRFLRHETVLLTNTLQGAAGQFAAGGLTALTAVYAESVISRGSVTPEATYAFLETSIGVGNLVGGFMIGLVGAHLAKGRVVAFGYILFGVCVALLAVAGALPLALGLFLGSGFANMVYIIPSQTLFQERTPPDLIGRVVGLRFSLVFGAMTLAMAISGLLASVLGVEPVLAAFGLLAVAAGLGGLLVPAVRAA
ncbi:MAG: MFS transporter [Chloroflexi bacterium]|nr:MAG: MFS transporter [Chloroflexota bacterium]